MSYLDGWNETTAISSIKSAEVQSVSVVIAAYNEERYIRACVESVLKADYPHDKLQLVVVDNGSTDKTHEILSSISEDRLVVLQEPKGFKKEALEAGFSESTGSIILCTDSDCIVPEFWIRSMVSPFQTKAANMVLGPVKIGKYRNLVERFQAFDMLAMMGVTAGGLKAERSYLANGANMAFTQKAYRIVGEIPRKDLASGDDVFLLHQFISMDKFKVHFQKDSDAVISTQAVSGWNNLIKQRRRWASKATAYVSSKDRFASAFIFVLVASIFLNLLLIPFTGGLSFFIALFQLFIKGTIDYAFLTQVNLFFKQKHLLRYFIPAFLVHAVYILFAGVSGLIGRPYNWRGRRTT